MANIIELSSASAAPASGQARQLIVFLHGYGADGNDLISLAPVFANRFADCAFAAPDAPQPCEIGFGRQWFGLADRSEPSMRAGVSNALPGLQAYIDRQQAAWNVQDETTVLVGFSQGTMMALSAGLMRDRELAGIVGFSGALVPTGDALKSRPPVLLVHGMADEVVPFTAMGQAEASLKSSGVPVESLAIPRLGHGIDPAGIEAALAFLNKIWTRK